MDILFGFPFQKYLRSKPITNLLSCLNTGKPINKSLWIVGLLFKLKLVSISFNDGKFFNDEE